MSKPRIGIVGAGLGGIAAALMLQRAGYAVTVYEQAPSLARIGAGINLGANAMRALKSMGLADMMYSQGLVPRRSLSREWDSGHILFDTPVDDWARRYALPNLIMHRGDLQAIMADGLEPGTIRFDRQLVGLEPTAGGVRLVFVNDATDEADLVIGADGVDSKVREILFGAEPPTYSGFVAYRSIFPTTRLGTRGLESDFSKWWSDDRHPAQEDRHFIIYYLTGKRDEVYFVTGSPAPDWDMGISSIPATIAEIRTCYEGFHPEVLRVIDACQEPTKWPLLTRPPMKRWSDGAVVLLGDACHPMKPHMGQGANMAIEDGVILARCIFAAADTESAFALYRATRFERVTRVQAESNQNLWMKYPTDPTWVFAYDPLTTPLGVARAAPAATEMESADVSKH